MNSFPFKFIKYIVILLAVASWFCGVANATPTAVINASVEWTFERAGDFQGWQPVNQLTNNVVAAGALTGLTTEGDPFWMVSVQAQASNFPYVVVRMKLQRTDGKPFPDRQTAQLFWVTRSLPGINESSSMFVDVSGDGQWHDYTFTVGENKLWKDTITSLRLDPCCAADVQVAIDSVRLQTVPGKDLILFHGKTYDAVIRGDLVGLIYPKDKGVRVGQPILISSRFNAPYSPPDPQAMLRFVTTEPPTVQAHKMIIHAATSNNIPLTQTWKFSDGTITVENQVKKYPGNEPSKWVCTFIRWPKPMPLRPT